MRIDQRQDGSARKIALKREIERARDLGPMQDPVCLPNCPDYDADLGCERSCIQAPLRLSSDPESFPVEPLIAPLVFELKKLGLFHPCWSCEGHNDNGGKLWKNPRLWFYSDSVVHVRALANTIEALHGARKLSVRWVVLLTFSDPDNPDTTFGLEPIIDNIETKLADLQADVLVLTENLDSVFWRELSRLENDVV